jgi:hypothetical protein
MANPLKRIVHHITGSDNAGVTGSIYKVCSNGATEEIHSASFGFKSVTGSEFLPPQDPTTFLNFALHYNANAGNTCIEADFSYISASVGTHVYIKTNGGSTWDTNPSS